MRVRFGLFSAACLFVLAAPAPVSAHHSFVAQFDENRPVSFTGVVTKVEWMNPHVWVYVDATGADGRVIHWEVEGSNPISLARRGWKKDSLKTGDRVVVEAFRSHCCENVANISSITLTDGTPIYEGTPEDRN